MYLHCLQHLVVSELPHGVLAALHVERSLDYFVSISFKLWIEEESSVNCVFSLYVQFLGICMDLQRLSCQSVLGQRTGE